MHAKYLTAVAFAALTLAACQRGQTGSEAAVTSGQEASQGDVACAREPGEPPQVGEGASQTTPRPCGSARSVMGESGKRPDEL